MTDKRPNNYNWRGWQKLHDEYVEKIESAGARVTYAKQKYGYLCFEVDCKGVANTEEVYRLIEEAEEKSLCICENCSSEEKVSEVDTGGLSGWIKTLCAQCAETEKTECPLCAKMPNLNAETIAAVEEVEEMKRNPHLYKSYDSVEALFEDLNNDGWDDDELSENDLHHLRLGEQELATGTYGNWANVKRD